MFKNKIVQPVVINGKPYLKITSKDGSETWIPYSGDALAVSGGV